MTSPIKANVLSNVKVQAEVMGKFLLSMSATLLVFLALTSNAATVTTDLGTAPLVSATTGDVLPNLMYILDNSGSMGNDYMPDYVNDSNKCKATDETFKGSCSYGDPAYNTKEFNSIYYNPAITYSAGLNADGSIKASMTSANTSGWTAVPVDAYGVQSRDQLGNNSVTTYSLVPTSATVGYPDKVWCNTNSATTSDLYDSSVCRQNSQYIYPTTTFNQPYTAYGYPYYYTVDAGEYCTDKNLTSCQSTANSTHAFPAKLRWCNSLANAAGTGNSGCQAKYIEGSGTSNYVYARWAGINSSSVGGIIKIKADTVACGTSGLPSCAAPSAMSITSVTINGIRIIPTTPSPALSITDTTSTTQRNSLAAAIATAINTFVPTVASGNPDFTATASGDEVTVEPVTGTSTGTIAMTFSTSPTVAPVPGTAATGSFVVTGANQNKNASVGSIKVNGVQIINCGSAVSNSSDPTAAGRNAALATAIAAKITSCTSTPEYTATASGATVNITSTVAAGASGNGTITISTFSNGAAVGSIINMANGVNDVPGKTYSIPNSIGQFTGSTPVVTTFDRVDIDPSITTYSKATTRTDCNAASCSYDQEMTNFANWYSYYRTRMQMMKTSTTRAFKTIDTRYRVGFISIANQSSNYLPIAQFNTTQKSNWYDQLLSTNPSTSTPLRSALSLVGRIYAGKNPVSGFTSDPVQFSCQQNFAILTTDGYWNTDSSSNVLNIDSSGSVGNPDIRPSPAPIPPGAIYEGTTAASNTLADVAKYYYDTDLRTGTAGSAACTGSTRPDGTTGDVCNNNVFVTTTDNNNQQHMTTFTLGLGVDATLSYTTDYKTATDGDFYELKQGTKFWPVPVADKQSAVDDLWHAAVNGQGTYFSAKDPNQLSTSLDQALSSIKAKVGAGSAAATSTLNPVSGDNYTYVASYTSVKWIGNLEARTVNTNTGKVSEDATWCVEDVLADTCATGSSVVSTVGTTTNGNSTIYQCVKPSVTTAAACASPGVYDATAQTCSVEIGTSCSGALKDNVSDSVTTDKVDSRNIYMNLYGVLGDFTSANLTLAGKNTNFSNTFLAANLSQYSVLSDGTAGSYNQRTLVNSLSLVNFLRGNNGYEDRASNVDVVPNPDADNRLYRLREATLGDLIDSTPVYVGVPKASFADPRYGPDTSLSSFKYLNASRAGTIYIGANDGMLHAINALNGEERWAYVPTMVLDNMWKLADKNYGNGVAHSYFVDGDIVVNDVCTSLCTSSTNAVWKTILVAGLNGGGKGYFALDITTPSTPVLLWEFGTSPEYTGDTSYDTDLGYSYGNPIITKKSDGTWVVAFASGYNNTSGSNPGKGILYVVDAATGNKLAKYSTGVGDDGVATGATGPSGLAQISAFVPDGEVNNQAVNIYGGDLLGNLWRFDINAANGATPFKLATLKDNASTPKVQPITVRPELAQVNGKVIVYVGTGKYLGTSDLPDTQQQTIYAITDETFLDSPRTSSLMVQQVLANGTTTATRTVPNPDLSGNLATGRGWYIDLPDSGERQNVPAQLVFGTLLVPTTVPSNTVCSPGGSGWLNFLDYKTGASVSGNVVSSKTNAPIVGINVLYINGKPVVNIVTADNPTPTFPPIQPTFTGGNASGFTNHRVIWRELIDAQ